MKNTIFIIGVLAMGVLAGCTEADIASSNFASRPVNYDQKGLNPMTVEFTDKEIVMLIEAEKAMDAGKLKFVLLGNNRVIVTAEAIEHFGLTLGQTITSSIFTALLRFNIASTQAAIALKKAQQGANRSHSGPK